MQRHSVAEFSRPSLILWLTQICPHPDQALVHVGYNRATTGEEAGVGLRGVVTTGVMLTAAIWAANTVVPRKEITVTSPDSQVGISSLFSQYAGEHQKLRIMPYTSCFPP
jgi:hypothetical protein